MTRSMIAASIICAFLSIPANAQSTGIASVYNYGRAANGEKVVGSKLTAAHRSLPFGTMVRVTRGKRSVVVRINDRGPFVRGRIIDLTPAGAHALGFSGLALVTIEVVQKHAESEGNTDISAARRHHGHHYRHHDGVKRHYARRHHRGGAGNACASCTSVRLADGQTIHVASAYAERFRGFFNALYHQHGRLPGITCLAAGHMPGGHGLGKACDVGQSARNVAAGMMYRVGALARAHGLQDGCSFSNPDCGHVEIPGSTGSHHRYARAGHGRHYASLYRMRHAYLHVRHRHVRYASRSQQQPSPAASWQ